MIGARRARIHDDQNDGTKASDGQPRNTDVYPNNYSAPCAVVARTGKTDLPDADRDRNER